jgi:hypothetical protein
MRASKPIPLGFLRDFAVVCIATSRGTVQQFLHQWELGVASQAMQPLKPLGSVEINTKMKSSASSWSME